jgi:hypothetical protein
MYVPTDTNILTEERSTVKISGITFYNFFSKFLYIYISYESKVSEYVHTGIDHILAYK